MWQRTRLPSLRLFVSELMRSGFMRLRHIAPGVMLAVVAGCAATGREDLPAFVVKLIEQHEAAPKSNPPGSIWRYDYQGRVVYYVPPVCCDVPSKLYDSDGNVICSPDGGLTGAGDGKCPDFFERRAKGLQVWRDNR
jgi:hypothetical protein